jgi:hypothetical protein
VFVSDATSGNSDDSMQDSESADDPISSPTVELLVLPGCTGQQELVLSPPCGVQTKHAGASSFRASLADHSTEPAASASTTPAPVQQTTHRPVKNNISTWPFFLEFGSQTQQQQLDVQNALSSGRSIYQTTTSYEDPNFPDHVYKLDKAIYGLK